MDHQLELVELILEQELEPIQELVEEVEDADQQQAHNRVLHIHLYAERGGEVPHPSTELAHVGAAESLAPDVANAAEADLQSLQHEAGRLWDEIDVLVTVLPCGPSTVESPDTIDTPDGVRPLREVLVPWTCLANLLGSPSAVAPVGTDRTGAPIAVQLMSRPGADALLLRCVDEWFGS